MNSLTILTAALGAAGRGFAVAFVRITAKGEKIPTLKSAHPEGDPLRGKCRGECGRLGHGIYDATTDEDRIVEMHNASRSPNGYAIACGTAPHHVLGLDLDRKNGHDGVARLQEIAETIGFALPPTIEVATPSGGQHKLYGLPATVRVPNSVGRLGEIAAPGIDVRSRGGQLVGPGSRGPKGTYRLTSDPAAPLAPCPPALLKLLVRDRPGAQAQNPRRPVNPGRRITGLIAMVLDAKPGRRNDALFWAGCRMAEAVAEGALTENDGRELLLTAAERIGLDYSEASVSIDSAFRTTGTRTTR